jgi:hypothetical protein
MNKIFENSKILKKKILENMPSPKCVRIEPMPAARRIGAIQ